MRTHFTAALGLLTHSDTHARTQALDLVAKLVAKSFFVLFFFNFTYTDCNKRMHVYFCLTRCSSGGDAGRLLSGVGLSLGLLGGLGVVLGLGERRLLRLDLVGLLRRLAESLLGRRAAGAGRRLGGQLRELLAVGQGFQHGVLPLQHRVPLAQLLDLLFQDLHLLAHRVHQMALHQVLSRGRRGLTEGTREGIKAYGYSPSPARSYCQWQPH